MKRPIVVLEKIIARLFMSIYGEKSTLEIANYLGFFPWLDNPISEERSVSVLENTGNDEYRDYLPLVLLYLLRDSPEDSYFVDSFLNLPRHQYLVLNTMRGEFIAGYVASNRSPISKWTSPCLSSFSKIELVDIAEVLIIISSKLFPVKMYPYHSLSIENLFKMTKAAVRL